MTELTEQVDFTFADLEAQVRVLAAAKPDYVYPPARIKASCHYQYVSKDSPRCIFGQSLFKLGVSEDSLRRLDGLCDEDGPIDEDGDFTSMSSMIDEVIELVFQLPDTTAENLTWAVKVQQFQDKGLTWGTAVQYADEGREVNTGD